MNMQTWKQRESSKGSYWTESSGKGFTLIELLVVIAIISLLVSILLPSLTKAKDLARRMVCATNQRGMVLAAMLYAQDYDGITPLGWKEPDSVTNGWWEDDNNFLKRIYPFTDGNVELFVCPSAPPDMRWGGIYAPTEDSQCSYAANYIITVQPYKCGVPIELVPNPAGIVYFSEVNGTRKSMSYEARNTVAGVNGVPVVDDGYGPYCIHEEGMNLGFVDSHTEYFKAGIPSNGMWGMTPDDHLSRFIGLVGGHQRAFNKE
jgi:prepilin-type N-terminal cleavage/methylation domain-containing protein